MTIIPLIKKILYEKNISSLISNGVVAFIGLVSFMLLTRGLPKQLFGEWVLFVTLASFTDLLRFGLTRTSVVRFLSGADGQGHRSLMGTSFRVNLYLVLLIAIVCWPVAFLLKIAHATVNNGYMLFLVWYPVLALFNLGWNNAGALFQSQQKFKRMMMVQLVSSVPFVLFLAANNFWLHWGIMPVVWAYLAGNLLASLWCSLMQWDGLSDLKHANRKVQKELLHFGKYSMGTLIGSSLLKSADTFIIGLSPVLGSVAIAMYAIPLKLTDLLGIPLRSFTMTAYPRMSKKSIEGDNDGVRKVFCSYSGAVTLLFVPVAIIGFVFAKQLVLFLGGGQYRDSLPMLVALFRIFTLYTIFLPVDRFTGVVLDSINKPRLNLFKVILMAIANVVVDLIGVFCFQSLEVVAIGTVFFTVLGIVLGLVYLKRELNLRVTEIATEGFLFFKNLKNFQQQ